MSAEGDRFVCVGFSALVSPTAGCLTAPVPIMRKPRDYHIIRVSVQIRPYFNLIREASWTFTLL